LTYGKRERRYWPFAGLIGSGIQGSRSPALHEKKARQQGLRLHYQLIDLEGARDWRGQHGRARRRANEVRHSMRAPGPCTQACP
jgi:shikimate 5-dehydrogenase